MNTPRLYSIVPIAPSHNTVPPAKSLATDSDNLSPQNFVSASQPIPPPYVQPRPRSTAVSRRSCSDGLVYFRLKASLQRISVPWLGVVTVDESKFRRPALFGFP